MSYTPKPWHAECNTWRVGGKGGQIASWFVRAGNLPIARVNVNSKDIYNAHLMAAAPDMLAALEKMEWGPNGYMCQCCYSLHDEEHDDDCIIHNAIKKAKGL